MTGQHDTKNTAWKATRLAVLSEAVQCCRKCRLHEGRSHAVYGEGPVPAAGMVLGEAPGEVEDRCGRPFMGRTGRYFDQALEKCRLRRDELFITPAVKCRPPGNRRPKKDELEVCRATWLDQQIELIDPSVILVMGTAASYQVFRETSPIKQIRGRFLTHLGRSWLITYHPSAAMRFPRLREEFEGDLARFAEKLKNIPDQLKAK